MKKFDISEIVKNENLSDTEAFRYAADLCYENCGGVIYVPKGKYTIASVRLYSNTHLLMDAEAEIYADPNEESYGVLRGKYDTYHTRDSAELLGIPKGEPVGYIQSLILCNLRRRTDCIFYMDGAENVTIEGGVLDGRYRYFFDIADENQKERFGVHVFRLQMIVAFGCRKLTFKNIRIRNNSCFNMRILQSEDIRCCGVEITADKRCLNTDGMNFASSRNILVENCSFDVGDDCIAFSTGEVEPLCGDCGDAIVRNCICKTNTDLIRAFAGVEIDVGVIAGLKLDSQIENAKKQTVRNILVENCTLASGGCMVNIIGSFGNVENIRVRNIKGKAENSHPAIFFITQREAKIRNVAVENIDFCGTCAVSIQGTSRESVKNITISDSTFTCTPVKKKYYHELPDPITEYWIAGEAPNNIFVRHASDVKIENCRIKWHRGEANEPFPAITVSDVDGFRAENIDADGYLCDKVIEYK
ncbi:MAG: hypothetical protein IKU43_02800 [Clostridia bacterium]|nr:hypothetical protein [Clostridia bacterium]